MSDEMIQQQRTPSAAPYVLTGGIVGGGASAVTGLWKPGWAYEKKTWDDLVEEMSGKDKVDFSKQLEGESEEVVNNVKKYQDKADALAKEWDDAFEAYTKANGAEVELPAESEEMKNLAEAQKNLDAKRAELEKAEADRIKAEEAAKATQTGAKDGGKELSEQYIKAKEKEIAGLKEKVAEAEAKVRAAEGNLEAIRQQFADTANQKAREINERMQLIADKKAQKLVEKDPNKIREINKAIKADEEALQYEIDNFARYQAEQIKPPKGMNQKQVAAFREQKAAEIKDYLVRLGQEMDTIVADPMKEVAELAKKQSAAKAKLQASGITLGEGTKSVENNIKAQKLKLEKLNNIKAKYAQFLEDAKPEDIEQIKSIFEHYDEKNNYKGKTVEKTPSGKKNIVNDFESLLDKDMKKDFKRLVDETGDVGQAIDSAIAKHTENIKELEAIAKVDRRIVELAGEGAKFENGVLKDAAGKEVKLTTPKVKVDGIEITTSKELESAQAELKGRQSKLNTVTERFEQAKAKGQVPEAEVKALTEEEIAAKAKAAIEKPLAETNEQKALDAAKKAVEDAKAKLPKGEAKSEETMLKEFIEKGGKGERNAYIKNGMKDVEEAGKKELSGWLEKGKGVFKKGKFLGITAAAVVAGAILGKLIAPKKEQV